MGKSKSFGTRIWGICTVPLIIHNNLWKQLTRHLFNLITSSMKNKYILTAMLLCMVLMAEAQENYFYINWDGNIPLSSKEFIDNTSGRGAKIGYRIFFGRNRRL